MTRHLQVVQRVQVLVLLLFRQLAEPARLLTVVDPADCQQLEARRPDELVQFGENSPNRVPVQMARHRACLHHKSEEVEVVTLLEHQFIGRGVIFLSEKLVSLEVNRCGLRLGAHLSLQGGNFGL